jgi:hypothetical protein
MRTSETPWICTILGQISPLDSALTDGPLESPLECALTKTGGRGATAARYRPGTSVTEWIESLPNTVLQWPEREKRRIPWNAGSEVEEKLQFVFENESGNKTDV